LSFSLALRGFTDGAIKVVSDARKEAIRNGHRFVTPDHILVALATGKAGIGQALLKRLGVDAQADPARASESCPQDERPKTLGLNPAAGQVLELAAAEARKLGNNFVGTEHLILGILGAGDNGAATVLTERGITIVKARDALLCLRGR
jgi:ATP-dependent Clp protease ATP-binding subunit ClpC